MIIGMARTFHLFHLSLIENLFSNEVDREEVIRDSLSHPFTFTHRKREFYWVPKTSEKDIIGYVQKETKHSHHYPPQEGGAEITENDWQGAIVVVDPTTHELGQRVAFERDNSIGDPNAILKSLLSYINQLDQHPFVIVSHPILSDSSFWEFAKNHDYSMKKLTFDFAVPNMWSAASNLEKELKYTHDDTGAEKVKMALIAESGINIKNSVIAHTGVEYATKGSASITAQSMNGEVYSSSKKVKRVRIDEKDRSSDENPLSFLQRIAKKLLGHE